MTYAILGWGSLLWDTDSLKGQEFMDKVKPSCANQWMHAEGLTLPLEFSRVSHKTRKGALTLVVDIKHGVCCPVYLAESIQTEFGSVIETLKDREGTTKKNIGYWERDGGKPHPKCESTNLIVAWAEQTHFAGVVWTALKSNYDTCTYVQPEYRPFKPLENPVNYLNKQLSMDGKKEAVKYVCNAPRETTTKLRQRLIGQSWFTEMAENMGLQLIPEDY